MKSAGLLLVLILSSVMLACAQTGYAQSGLAEQLSDANSAYRLGQYSQAKTAYEKAITAGIQSPSLYYNYANALFQLERYGAALAWYRKALHLEPGNPDFRANLQKVRSVLKTPAPPPPESLLVRTLAKVNDSFAPRSIQSVFLLSYVLFWNLLLVVPKLSKRRWYRFCYPPVLFFLGLSGISLFFLSPNAQGGYQLSMPFLADYGRPAVVIQEATARSGDAEKFAAVFKLKDGAEVLHLETRNNWSKIRVSSGRVGWIPQKHLEII